MTDTFESENTSISNIKLISNAAIAIDYSSTQHSENMGDVNEASKDNDLIELTNITIDSADTETVAYNPDIVQGNYYIMNIFVCF